MNLVEVMAAAVVFALASNASLQLWGASASWSRRAEDRRQALERIETDLLRRSSALRLAAADVAAPMACDAAGEWMGEQLAGASTAEDVALEEGEAAGELWLVLRAEGHGIERRRLFTAAAHGLCQPLGTDTEVGA